jgi:hypothetical protein
LNSLSLSLLSLCSPFALLSLFSTALVAELIHARRVIRHTYAWLAQHEGEPHQKVLLEYTVERLEFTIEKLATDIKLVNGLVTRAPAPSGIDERTQILVALRALLPLADVLREASANLVEAIADADADADASTAATPAEAAGAGASTSSSLLERAQDLFKKSK